MACSWSYSLMATALADRAAGPSCSPLADLDPSHRSDSGIPKPLREILREDDPRMPQPLSVVELENLLGPHLHDALSRPEPAGAHVVDDGGLARRVLADSPSDLEVALRTFNGMMHGSTSTRRRSVFDESQTPTSAAHP